MYVQVQNISVAKREKKTLAIQRGLLADAKEVGKWSDKKILPRIASH
jgi:hypothetical protein